MRRFVGFGAIGFACVFVAGCTFGGGAGPGNGEELPDRGPGTPSAPAPSGEQQATPAAPAPGAGTECGFAPANGIGCESGPSAELGAECEAFEIDTTSGKFACGIAAPSKLIDQGPGNPKIRVFYVNGLRIGRDSKVRVTGANALAIVSRGDVVIEGILDLSAENRECNGGPGGYRGGEGANAKGANGFGLGGGVGGVYPAGASGGSFGGLGGAGGSDVGSSAVSGSAAGVKYGNAELVPLMGGSGGGGDQHCGGGGGGAIQIASSTSILIVAGGGINAGGASSRGYYGGGGSGGAILVEAPKVNVQGTLAANGGGGGYGCAGELASTPACGGTSYEGGVGSSAIDGNGAPGADGDSYGGGGGGGAGRIRIVTHAESAQVPGTVSPAFSTTLSTQTLIAQ